MEYRAFGRTGWKVSATGTGTWAMGSLWGPVDDRESLAALNRAVDLGVNLFDTADVYGSEPLLGRLRRNRKEAFPIATKLGMKVNPDPGVYNRKNIGVSVESSLKNLGVDTLDLLQLHCPPIEVYNAARDREVSVAEHIERALRKVRTAWRLAGLLRSPLPRDPGDRRSLGEACLPPPALPGGPERVCGPLELAKWEWSSRSGWRESRGGLDEWGLPPRAANGRQARAKGAR